MVNKLCTIKKIPINYSLPSTTAAINNTTYVKFMYVI